MADMNCFVEASGSQSPPAWPPLFRDRHVHVGCLVSTIGEVAREAERRLKSEGIEVALSAGPWGGFNFLVGQDGYTRMPIGRLTVVIGSPAETPLEENGGPVFQAFMPPYIRRLGEAGWIVPDEWEYRHHKWSRAGRLLELSCVHYLRGHSYDSRTFLKVRLSREWEAYEEILLRDFLVVLERLHLTTDWNLYKEETRLVDVRFDLQDFLSLNYVLGPLFERTPVEEALLREITDSYLAHTRDAPPRFSSPGSDPVGGQRPLSPSRIEDPVFRGGLIRPAEPFGLVVGPEGRFLWLVCAEVGAVFFGSKNPHQFCWVRDHRTLYQSRFPHTGVA